MSNYLSNARNVDETVFESCKVPSKPEFSSKNYLQYAVPTNDLLNQCAANNPNIRGKPSSIAINGTNKVVPEENYFAKSFKVGDIRKTRAESDSVESRKTWNFINLSKKVHPSNNDD